MRVRAGSKYVYQPTLMDQWDARTDLKAGDVVKVVKLNGCPPPNTMGHCHVEKDGVFAGLVMTNSLQPISRKGAKST